MASGPSYQSRPNGQRIGNQIDAAMIFARADFVGGIERLDAMKGCKAWAKRAHACDYEKQHDNPS
jgi:hypothetical protein